MSTAIVSSKDIELEEMIQHLQTRMVYLEGRVAILETNKNPVAPTYPTWPAPYPTINNSRCSKCGLILSNTMGYVCGDLYCPTFVKTVAYTTGT